MKLESTLDVRCGTISGYSAHRTRKENYCVECKEAKRIYNAKYQKDNSEKIAAVKAKWCKDNRDSVAAYKVIYRKNNPKQYRLSNARYRKNNSERIKVKGAIHRKNNLEQMVQYRKDNFEKIKVKGAEWRKNNPEKVAQKRRARRAKIANVKSETYIIQEVLNLYGTNCHICLDPIDLNANRSTNKPNWQKGLHIDHVIPICKGGDNTLENVRPAHALCNIKKGKK